jgi:hypothetical protein
MSGSTRLRSALEDVGWVGCIGLGEMPDLPGDPAARSLSWNHRTWSGIGQVRFTDHHELWRAG